jgi:hypothetical protein
LIAVGLTTCRLDAAAGQLMLDIAVRNLHDWGIVKKVSI